MEVVGEVGREVAGEVVGEVFGVVVDEVDTQVVHPDVVVVDLVPFVTADTKVTTYSTEPSMHTGGGFPRGPIDWSMLIEYAVLV